jgi:hypothetical protein
MRPAPDLIRWWRELREARLREERGPDWENEENYADARENDVERPPTFSTAAFHDEQPFASLAA